MPIALTSIGPHYDGIDFDAIGRGYASKFDDDILAIGSATIRGTKILPSKVSATGIYLQYQSPGA